ncbi:hypothetical protein [Sphingopyxis indica]|nr:hypothetical protein [Sphingopyxis indica]
MTDKLEPTQAEGPRVTVKASCFECRHCVSESYRVQSDSGSNVYCAHPDFEQRKRVGDTRWETPDWCPVVSLPDIRHRATHSGEGRAAIGPTCAMCAGYGNVDGVRCTRCDGLGYRRAAHSGEGRSYGVGELRARAIAIVQEEARALGYIDEDIEDFSNPDGDDLLAVQAVERALALTPQGDGEPERLRGSYMAGWNDGFVQGATEGMPGAEPIQAEVSWSKWRAALQRDTGGER